MHVTQNRVQQWKKSITREKVAHAMWKEEYVSENLKSPAEVHTFLNSDLVRTRMEGLSDGQEDSLTLRR